MFKNLVDRLAGNPYERELTRYRELVEQVADLEPEMQAMPPDDAARHVSGLVDSLRRQSTEIAAFEREVVQV